MKKRLTILGSTGSIGTNTLDVVARHADKFEVVALTGAQQVDLMWAQCLQFKPRYVVMAHQASARALQDKVNAEGLPIQVMSGAAALDEVASLPEVDAVMAAIVGAAGLSPCLAAARGQTPALGQQGSLGGGGRGVFAGRARRRCDLAAD